MGDVMTLPVKDATGATKDLETGAGDGIGTPFRSPVSAAVGKVTDTPATDDTGDFSVIALIKRVMQNWTTLLARIPGLGQAVSGSSLPVVLPAAQITSLAAPVLGAGANAIGSVAVSNFPGTQAVSGTVELGATALAALETITVASVTAPLAAGTNLIGKAGIDQTTPGTTNRVALQDYGDGDYETVAASQTDQVLGVTGATGDFLSGLLIVPATTAAGAVSVKDGTGSAISLFAGGGTTALTTLIPFFVPLGMKSSAGAWKVTTGASVSVIAVGNFT